MTLEEKLVHFREMAIEKAAGETDAMLKEYQQALDRQYEEHRQNVVSQTMKELSAQLEAVKREGNQKLAHGHLVNKRALNQKNTELKDKLFEELDGLVENYLQSGRYLEVLQKQIVSAKAFAKRDDIIIYLDPRDIDKKRALEEATGCFLTMSQYSFGGGMRAVIPARNILIDNSIDARMAEVRDSFQFH